MTKLTMLLFVVVGLINVLPVMGLFSVERMAALYEVGLEDRNLQILMRHRALLFGLVGGFIIVAAFVPAWRTPAIVFGFVSMMGFIALSGLVGDYNDALRKVVKIDWIGIGLLVVATVLHWRMSVAH